MLKFEHFKVAFYLIMVLCVASWAAAIWSNDSLMGRTPVATVMPALPIKLVRYTWKDAHSAGAPIYRHGEQPSDWSALDPLPASKAYVLTGNGVSFATDDLAEVKRWYAQLTYPSLDHSQWPDVRYVYEVTDARVVQQSNGSPRLLVTVHEARTGCVAPACDPVNGLPNYDRSYEVEASSMTIHIEGGGNA